MEFLKNLELSPAKVFKIAGIGLIAFIIVVFVIRLLMVVVSPTLSTGVYSQKMMQGSSMAYDVDDGYYSEEMAYGDDSIELSARNITSNTIPSPEPSRNGEGATGSDAEDYEITQYNTTIETRDLERTCATITALKPLDYVIFESANVHDRGCNYTFKVEREHALEIFTVIDALDPKDLSETTRTIKRTIDDYTSETEILENKLRTLSETLNDAVLAYDSITDVATRNQDAESLARIIDSKIGVIERLTRERITISAQLDRLSRSKSEQLDRLAYTYFYVNVYENKFIDGENIKDSWKASIKSAVYDINRTVQDMTVNLIAVLFVAVQFIIYLVLLLVVAKYVWKLIKYIWNK